MIRSGTIGDAAPPAPLGAAPLPPPLVRAQAAWARTLPQRVVPLANECLLGLLWRCDQLNGWPVGMTLRLANPLIAAAGGTRDYSLTTGNSLGLAVLAEYLDLPLAALERTVWCRELARLRGTVAAQGPALRPRMPFRICPACIAESDLITRTVLLPGILSCPEHAVLFTAACACGRALDTTHRAAPFHCAACGQAWATLPATAATEAIIALDRLLGDLYALFLLNGSPLLVESALTTMRAELRRLGRWTLPVLAAHGLQTPYLLSKFGRLALPTLLISSVSIGVTADRIWEDYRTGYPPRIELAMPHASACEEE